VAFILWLALFRTSVALKDRRADTLHPGFKVFSTFYFVGTIIFGGGPVVIPLLQTYMLAHGWMSSKEFLLGLAIIQALPGPMFNFSAYCGALAMRRDAPVLGALLAYAGIFLPGILLKVAVLPVWTTGRTWPGVAHAFTGVNSCAVGLVVAAVYLLTGLDVDAPGGDASVLASPLLVSIVAVAFTVSGSMVSLPAPLVMLAGGVMGAFVSLL
jgi:chromate transport protein ChrA